VLAGFLTAVAAGLVLWLHRDQGSGAVQVRTALGGLITLPDGLRDAPTTQWTYPAQGRAIQWLVSAGDDLIVVAERGDELDIVRLDGVHGDEEWRTSTAGGEVRAGDMADGTIVLGVMRGASMAVEAFDEAGGAPLWTYERPADNVMVSLPEGTSRVVGIVPAAEGQVDLFVLDERGGEVWSSTVANVQVEGSNALVERDGGVALVDLASGAERWQHLLPDGAEVGLSGERSFVADRQGITAYGLQGEELWRQSLPSDAPVGIHGQGGLVLLVRESGVAALEASDGHRRWEGPAAGVFADTSSTTLTIRSTDDDFTLRVVDRTGSPEATRIVAPPAGFALADDVIYLGDGNGVSAYDRTSLEPLWSTLVAEDGESQVIHALDGGVVVRDPQGDLVVLR
jgi:outer membrane protein assembly factor BamB